MKPLIVLIAFSIMAIFTLKLINGVYNITLSARIGMSIMLLFTAMGHFMFTEGMTMMIPDFIPLKKEIVYFTAMVEILGAIGLHIPQFRTITAWLLVIFFIMMSPANIKASIEQIDYQKASFNGNGLMYLWFRIPLQFLFILWVYFSAIKII
ncbi:DoxX family protein [Winogradskyella sediminis]|uniref:DoxX family protein n=1 Tax=Winogradskyella sediminis TaxID=1382466 RepID=UPI000E248056|nr:hypothetical protein [Winogradskyella sediminis]REG87887.1 putative membrane protein [Winogradskyella sediminis]